MIAEYPNKEAGMKATKVIGLLVTTSAAMLLFAGVVGAASPDGSKAETVDAARAAQLTERLSAESDPKAAFLALTPVEQAAVERYVTVASVISTTEVVDDGTTETAALNAYPCKTNIHTKELRNDSGDWLVRYTSQTRWCFDYFRVLRSPAPRFTTSYRTKWPWRKKGSQTKRSWWGTADLYYRDFASQEFENRCFPFGCDDEVITIEKIQNANGTSNAW